MFEFDLKDRWKCVCVSVRVHACIRATERITGAKLWNLEKTVLRHGEKSRMAGQKVLRGRIVEEAAWARLFGASHAQPKSLDFIL